MKAKTTEKIVFDDITPESQGKWAQICEEHAYQVENSKEFSNVDITDGGNGVCNVKGCQNESEYCLHVKTMREKAIAWWKTLSDKTKNEATIMVISPKRSYKGLTGREIEIIYKWTLEN